ncbi:hypothetical protein EJ08DRAFT_666400 [Tothia fuscella]|uniref:Peptidase M20 domain-containing protein 2 n=1 Tax=Tothia fuscella TaxID=1048955 RepID=A0A9P4NEI6_9PEZI|nr:hypothetical protein EJ08DRAFT_666400 [Tothia fuscella]
MTSNEDYSVTTESPSTIQKVINDVIKRLDTELRDINHKIHSTPELGYAEFQAHDNVVALLQSQGISVKPHIYGLQTSFEAEYGSGGRVVVFNVEYDSLPGIGHACGHNLIATSSLAAFFVVVGAMKKNNISGRVRALGTPAEEGGGGKIKLIDAGAYKDVDACLMTHPMSGTMFPTTKDVQGVAYGTSVASAKFRATFSDAAILAYTGISMLRQQILPNQKIHGIIMEGGEKANVIPSRSKMDYNVRGSTLKETKILQKRVEKCFEGAAVATGCELEFKKTNNCAEVVPSRSLCIAYSQFMSDLGSPQLCDADGEDSQPQPGSYSTDQGNVTQICPGFHPVYNIPTANGASNHTKEFTAAVITEEAYQLTLLTSKGMAATAWKVLVDDDFAKKVKTEFEQLRTERESLINDEMSR